MNQTLQTIIILVILGFALGFLVKKFIWSPSKKKNNNACSDDNCGC